MPAPDNGHTPPLHLCIATGQNLANLIPALQCGAGEVWILQTATMRSGATHLATALKARGIAVERIDFDDASVVALHAQVAALAERLDGRPVTINLTGGTKLMTLALAQTLAPHLETGAAENRPHLVYTDTVRRRLDWLAPVPRSEPMRGMLTINDILLAQGYRRQGGSGGAEAAHWQRAAMQREAPTRFIGDEAAALARFIGAANLLAQRALNEPVGPWEPEQRFDFTPAGKAAQALRLACEAGVLSWPGEARIIWRDAEAARYLGGGWVEEFAALKIAGFRHCEWAPRLLIKHADSGATNELDAVVVHDNRMLVVECKAARGGEGKAADWIYKASQLAHAVGGQLARPLLLSARTLGEEHLRRAVEYEVDVLAGPELARFTDYLRRWVGG